MLFHSHEYVLLFLPLTVIGYYFLRQSIYSKIWLLLASMIFYSWWNPAYLPLLLASILLNYTVGMRLAEKPSRIVLALGISANLAIIGYYKYFNFFIKTYDDLAGKHYQPLDIILPLAISFYTFQQIAFLVDAHKQKVTQKSFIDYAMFVTFFPHLIAGPLLNHKVMMKQFSEVGGKTIDYGWIARGLFVFSIGLFKILVIAQPLSVIVNQAYEEAGMLSLSEAWVAAGAFILQLYFDFSAYSDMAVGSALMLGFILPYNFNSPYRKRNIIQFWQCWNITLGWFFRDYCYTKLCGRNSTQLHRNIAILFTFLLIGLWHGAAWTYVWFGVLNGCAMVVARLWRKTSIRLPYSVSWLITIIFLLCIGVMFRAHDVSQAMSMYKNMFDVFASNIGRYHLPPRDWIPGLSFINALWAMPLSIIICAWPYNSISLGQSFRPSKPYFLATIMLLSCAIIKMIAAKAFIYFQF